MSDLSLRIATSEEDILKVLVVRGIVFIEEQRSTGKARSTSSRRPPPTFWAKSTASRWRPAGCAIWTTAGPRSSASPCGPAGAARGLRQGDRGLHAGRRRRPPARNKFKMHAQVYLEDFYGEFGFRREGGIFDECGIDHILMVREDG